MAIFHYRVNDSQIAVQMEHDKDGYRVSIGDRSYRVLIHKRNERSIAFTMNGQPKQVHMAYGNGADERTLWFNGRAWDLEKVDPRSRRQRASIHETSGALVAAMPGQVREISVAEGDTVCQGDLLVVLEAMKMEMRLSAPIDGVVTLLSCGVGDVVERGQLLVTVTPLG
ncbi:MAG: biotin/lipoyl-containing protein [Chloroflexota bacterium]